MNARFQHIGIQIQFDVLLLEVCSQLFAGHRHRDRDDHGAVRHDRQDQLGGKRRIRELNSDVISGLDAGIFEIAAKPCNGSDHIPVGHRSGDAVKREIVGKILFGKCDKIVDCRHIMEEIPFLWGKQTQIVLK